MFVRLNVYSVVVNETNRLTLTQEESIDDVSSRSQLWLYVSSWQEGLSSWLVSLSEVVVLCKELNATFVEPCIQNGRLTSCKDSGSILLSQVIDMERLREYHEKIATYDEFVAFSNRSNDRQEPLPTFQICMHHFTNVNWCNEVPLFWGSKNIPIIEEARISAQSQSTVLQVHQYGRFAFRHSAWASEKETNIVKRKYIQFATANFVAVSRILEKMGIPAGQEYSVVHWRAERPNIDYLACADHILRARELMHNKEHPFILMSSLNTRSEYMWGGAKLLANETTSQVAVQRLLDSGFHKLDQVVSYDDLPDQVMLAVYDLILAMQADKFATCTQKCADNSVCSACNWRGSFGALAVDMRSDIAHKSSVTCWPSDSSSQS